MFRTYLPEVFLTVSYNVCPHKTAELRISFYL